MAAVLVPLPLYNAVVEVQSFRFPSRAMAVVTPLYRIQMRVHVGRVRGFVDRPRAAVLGSAAPQLQGGGNRAPPLR